MSTIAVVSLIVAYLVVGLVFGGITSMLYPKYREDREETIVLLVFLWPVVLVLMLGSLVWWIAVWASEQVGILLHKLWS